MYVCIQWLRNLLCMCMKDLCMVKKYWLVRIIKFYDWILPSLDTKSPFEWHHSKNKYSIKDAIRRPCLSSILSTDLPRRDCILFIMGLLLIYSRWYECKAVEFTGYKRRHLLAVSSVVRTHHVVGSHYCYSIRAAAERVYSKLSTQKVWPLEK